MRRYGCCRSMFSAGRCSVCLSCCLHKTQRRSSRCRIRRTLRPSRRSTMWFWSRSTAFGMTILEDTARPIFCNLDSKVRALPRACCPLIRRLHSPITSASSQVSIRSITASSPIASGTLRASRPMSTRSRNPTAMAVGTAARLFGCWQSSRGCGRRVSSGLAPRPRSRVNDLRIICTSTTSWMMKNAWTRL